MRPTYVHVTLICAMIVVCASCSRTHYRLRADRDSYGILRQKTECTPLQPESDFSIYPKPHSRLYTGPCVDFPCLPNPSPQLYAYELPPITERDPSRFRAFEPIRLPSTEREAQEPELLEPTDPIAPVPQQELGLGRSETPFRQVAYQDDSISLLPPENGDASSNNGGDEGIESENLGVQFESSDVDDEENLQKKAKIPEEYWKSVPQDCLRRMLEFESILSEYNQTYGRDPSSDVLDDSPRLALEDIVQLTLLNSRELQTQKETLYRTALALTLQRFDYQLKPSTEGNGSAANFAHNRSPATAMDPKQTQNTLGIPTGFQVDKMLFTGGDILARFANSIVLTFNGKDGFESEIGSELFFEITQRLLQRDMLLEDLTQAERNVIYAARDYVRFRKQLFVTLANNYYSLILQFRQIEINTQNYFTLVREFRQTQEEFRAGLAPRVQLDQIEQQVINGRRELIESCTDLENALDRLKVSMGLPTEQMINLDLTELRILTARDELAVNAELINRVRDRLDVEIKKEFPSQAAIISAASVLVERQMESMRLRERIGGEVSNTHSLEQEKIRLQVQSAKLRVSEAQKELLSKLNDESPTQLAIFQRRMDVISELLPVIRFYLKLDEAAVAGNVVQETSSEYDEMARLASSFTQRFERLIAERQLDELDRLLSDAQKLQTRLEQRVRELDEVSGLALDNLTDDQRLRLVIANAREMLQDSGTQVSQYEGLTPVEIEMDDAMMTALVQRLDLMNERGVLADDWRRIKYAADDLKSVLNLQASQAIGTSGGRNPFDFSFDDSRTEVSITFDAPFNRRQQRNDYRTTLIDYQAAIRRLTELEDNIKLTVREEIRTLDLTSIQYVIDIASAALAYERVVSTELELRLGIGNVAARDFLEAQTAYIAALSGVARRHIGYIVGRMELFLDLESLTVGDDGFWQELYDESHQPEPFYQLPGHALPAFGRLHPCLKYSDIIRHVERAPTGTAMIHKRPREEEDQSQYGDDAAEIMDSFDLPDDDHHSAPMVTPADQ